MIKVIFILSIGVLNFSNFKTANLGVKTLNNLNKCYSDSIMTTREIYFDMETNLDTIRSKKALQEIENFIISQEGIYEISVHSDTRFKKGTAKNMTQHKAQLIVDYLVKNGFPSDCLIPVGYSYNKPIIENPLSESDHQFNRRVEIKRLK
jgi:outer membrane protein OmpA-like peptidoglycan-associated protein